jgi:hypothetical protein
VCYYRFSKDPQKSITFFGGFVAFGLRTSHRVRGRKIRDRERAEFDRDGGKSILQQYVKDQTKTPEAGGASGAAPAAGSRA